jgi:hypothetical protein
MSSISILFILAFGALLALLMWRLSTMKTDPEGYQRIATLDGLEAWRARTALERAHIPVIVDSHRGMMRGGYGGPTYILVPIAQVQTAIRVLKETDMTAEFPPA